MIKKLYPVFFILMFFFISCEEDNPMPPTPPVTNTPQIDYFSVNTQQVRKGDTITLAWSVINAESVSIDQNIGAVQALGTKDVIMEEIGQTSFTLTAINSVGSKTATVTITVDIKISILWETRYDYLIENTHLSGPVLTDVIQLSDGSFASVGTVYSAFAGYSYPIFVRIDSFGNVTWTDILNPIYEIRDRLFSIVKTIDNGFFIVHNRTVSSNGIYDEEYPHIFRLNKRDRIIWQKNLNGGGLIDATDCVLADDGDYVFVGKAQKKLGVPGEHQIYIRKYNEANLVWERKFSKDDSSETSSGANNVIKTSDGGYVILGSYQEKINEKKESSIYLIKIGSKGNPFWDKIIPNSSPRAIIQTKDNGYLIFGYPLDDDLNCITVIKTDSDGNIEKENKFACDGEAPMVTCIIGCSDGNYLIAGYTHAYFGSDTNVRDVYLAKVNISGELIWQTIYNPNNGKRRADLWAFETGDDEYIIIANENAGQIHTFFSNIWVFKIKIEI